MPCDLIIPALNEAENIEALFDGLEPLRAGGSASTSCRHWGSSPSWNTTTAIFPTPPSDEADAVALGDPPGAGLSAAERRHRLIFLRPFEIFLETLRGSWLKPREHLPRPPGRAIAGCA